MSYIVAFTLAIAAQNRFDTRSQIDINRFTRLSPTDSWRARFKNVWSQVNDTIDILAILSKETMPCDIEKIGIRNSFHTQRVDVR